jgi:hypothetical protein
MMNFEIVDRADAPTSGNWKRGSVVVNNDPAAGEPRFWICTVSGEPGTWVPIYSASFGEVLTTTVGVGAKNGATVTAVELGDGVLHQTVLTLAATPVTVANTTGASFGGVKVYDFPAGRILIQGVTVNLSFNWTDDSSPVIAQDGSGDFSMGSTITADATLATTDVDLLPSTAMTDPFLAGVGTGAGALAASFHYDGTATALDANLNIIIDDADVANATTADVLVSGTVTITWTNLGDY